MAEHSYTSRRELDQYRFHPFVAIFAPFVCLLLQAVLPKFWPKLIILDLPLIATIFFAVARRNPIAGTATGTIIGLFQDGLTSQPFGVNGIAKSVIGYIAASIGFTVDVENMVNRVALNFGFTLLQSAFIYVITRWLLADPTVHMRLWYELLRAVCNTAVAIPIFFVLDRFRQRE
ncbi:MAG TPA: rod shape-determining protein MreD [Acidobacteriaceae bacterium]|jgi:rod shape-determining protein MreD